jgi:H+/Cl- antiporter ClcA
MKLIRALIFTIMALLTFISIFRVYYVTNTYWGRELVNVFPFSKELGIYSIYVGILIITYLIVRKIFPKIFGSIIKTIQ